MPVTKPLQRAARIVAFDCLAIKPREKAVIVTDAPCRAVGDALWSVLRHHAEAILVEMNPREIHGMEPPQLIAELLNRCDVFIIPTSRSLTHTKARINACRAGARGATMPGITADMMIRTLNADYRRIARLTGRVASRLTSARKARIRTVDGTDLELDLRGRIGDPDTGIVVKSGAFSNLPAGEAYIAPVESKSEGVVVVDGSFAPFGRLSRPVRLEVRHGRIERITGNDRLKAVFDRYGARERVLCELGIGTNYKAIITGNVLEDEKVLGSVHVAFGNNLGFGGRNQASIHLDGVITKPSFWLDDEPVIIKGKLLL